MCKVIIMKTYDIVQAFELTVRKVFDYESAVFQDADWVKSKEAKLTALALCCCAVFFSLSHVYRHLRQFSMPQIQIYVIRIILTCAVYAISSTVALLVGPYAAYAETLRDVYEAIVVYSFFNLILEYGGGEADCIYAIENDGMLKMPCPLCCTKPRHRNAKLLRFCHRGVLQFVITKPIVAFLDIIFLITGLYDQPAWQVTQMLIYNISYGWALYCLAVFYMVLKKVISQFRPMAKFATVKLIIFATFYQGVALYLALSKPSTAVDWNNMLICAEMVLFSIAFMVAFPVREFDGGIPHRRVLRNAKEVFTFRDIRHNLYHNFMPEYRDYSLQNCQQEVPSTIHEHTHMTGLSKVAQEMAERYRGRSTKKSFNALLRGSNPITAHIRRSRQEIHSNNSSQQSMKDESDEESAMLRSSRDMAEVTCNQLHADGLYGEKHDPLDDMELGESKTSMGRLPLKIKSKAPAVAASLYLSSVSPAGSGMDNIVKFSPHAISSSTVATSSSVDSAERDSGGYQPRAVLQEVVPGRPKVSSASGPTDHEKENMQPALKLVEDVKSPLRAARSSSRDPFNSPSVDWSDYAEYHEQELLPASQE